MTGYEVCAMHGAKGGENKRSDQSIPHGRRANLTQVFGPKFQRLTEDADGIRGFETDNALFLLREDELSVRVKVGDSKRYRERLLAGLEDCIISLSEDDYSGLAQKLIKLQEFAHTGVQHDSAFEQLLFNSERRVKLATAAMTALAKEQSTLTMKDMAHIIEKFLVIVMDEVGEAHAYRINRRYEREVLTPLGCVEDGPSTSSSAPVRH